MPPKSVQASHHRHCASIRIDRVDRDVCAIGYGSTTSQIKKRRRYDSLGSKPVRSLRSHPVMVWGAVLGIVVVLAGCGSLTETARPAVAQNPTASPDTLSTLIAMQVAATSVPTATPGTIPVGSTATTAPTGRTVQLVELVSTATPRTVTQSAPVFTVYPTNTPRPLRRLRRRPRCRVRITTGSIVRSHAIRPTRLLIICRAPILMARRGVGSTRCTTV